MSDIGKRSRPVSRLRREAEEILDEVPSSEENLSPDVQSLLHELRVHQIELEIQNEELRDAQQVVELSKQKAEEVRDRFMRLFHEAPVGYAVVDGRGMMLSANQTLRDMAGIAPEAPLERFAFANLLYSEDEKVFRARFPAFFDEPRRKRMEIRLRVERGEDEFWTEVTGRTVSWSFSHSQHQQSESQLLLIISDLRERKKLEGEISLAAKVFEHSAEGIVITDHNGRILRVNHAFSVVTGYSEEEVLGKTPRVLKSGRHPEGFYRQMWNSLLSEGRWQGEIWNKRKSGEVYPEWLHICAVRNRAGKTTNYISIFSDISDKKHAERQLERLAHYDALTNLPNRVLFYDRLKQEMIKAKRYDTSLAVMMLDLDRFKAVNDSLGHAAGDLLLQQVARRLERSMRASDTLARLGGDEFIILLPSFPDTDSAAKAATKVARQIVETLAEPIDLNGSKVTVSTSLGVAISPQDGGTLGDVIKHADAAMYNAKDQGRNNYQFYSAAIHARSQERARMEHDLREALEKGEFFMVYQPKVNLCAGRIVGLEALVRWRRGDEIISPDRFIPVAEDSGVILPLSQWILDEAFSLAARLQGMVKPPFNVAVNLSLRQLAAPQQLVDQVHRGLKSWELDPGMLEMELTETAMIRETQGVHWALSRLKEMGLRVALDDFGTGYSSLSYLRRFPLDTIKIDRSFVGDIGRDPDDESIVRSVIVLAQSLGLDVVAEGIEHEIQRFFLLDNGCATGQGYLFWKPMPVDQLFEVLRDEERRLARIPASSGSAVPNHPLCLS